MYKIALIQNSSELKNYSYADLRMDLQKMNFEVISYSRDNIEALGSILPGVFDCVLFASNSLNDGKVYEYVCSEVFVEAYNKFLDRGGTSLIMHQNALKEKENPLPFIKTQIKKLRNEYADNSITLKKSGEYADAFFAFPNRINEDEINRDCLKNTAVSGKYWMILEGEAKEWTPILIDNQGNAIIQRMNNGKVIFSSVLLDYQKHTKLLENVLVNLMTDNVSIAIVDNNSWDGIGFSYFLNALDNRKLYYYKYKSEDKQEIDNLLYNVKLGIHNAVILNEDVKKIFSSEMIERFNHYGVKVIELNDKDLETANAFAVYSVDRNSLLEIYKIELEIQKELVGGFVSGSFMKTIEVLTRLKKFEEKGLVKGTYDKHTIVHVIEKTMKHIDKNGSYDATFGATCKALWLFNTFLGGNAPETKLSRNYIENLSDVDTIRENLYKYLVLSDFENDRRGYLREKCVPVIEKVINNSFLEITEYDFIILLQIAVEIGDARNIIRLADYIKEHIDKSGKLFNAYVTAMVLLELTDFYHSVDNNECKTKIHDLIFDMVMYLKNCDISEMSVEERLQVVCALCNFEKIVSFPVNDLIELVLLTGSLPGDMHRMESQISNYEKNRLEMDSIVSKDKALEKENRIYKWYKRGFWITVPAVVVVTYITIYLLIILNDNNIPVIMTLISKIKESWGSLFSIIVIPVITFVYDKFIKNKEDK